MDFPGVFVRVRPPGDKIQTPCVEALMFSQALRSLGHNGTQAALVRLTARPPLSRTPMNKLVKSLALLTATGCLSILAGCDLYFGDHGNNNNDNWSYCGSDG